MIWKETTKTNYFMASIL